MYPVRYEAKYVEKRDRWTTAFRPILAIPWLILGSIYVLAASVVALIAWFAILFTGRYPDGLYGFNAGVLRFSARANAFFYLQTDKWPPFGLEQDRRYPIRADVDSPLDEYNRWKTGFRLIVGIPVMIMLSLFASLYPVAATIAWFHIVFTERTSGGVHNALTVGLAYQLRASAYFLLMTETFPPVSDQAPAETIEPSAPAKRALGRGSAAKPKPKPATRKPAAKRSSSSRSTAAKRSGGGARKTSGGSRSTGTTRKKK